MNKSASNGSATDEATTPNPFRQPEVIERWERGQHDPALSTRMSGFPGIKMSFGLPESRILTSEAISVPDVSFVSHVGLELRTGVRKVSKMKQCHK
jgi:hypothetical protein